VSNHDEVLAAAQARAAALAAADAAALRDLLHPAFGWLSHRGEAFDRDTYIAANTSPSATRWREQRLDEVHVVVVEATAILRAIATDTVITAEGEHSLRMPMTQTWVRDSGRWRCVAGHAAAHRRRPLRIASRAASICSGVGVGPGWCRSRAHHTAITGTASVVGTDGAGWWRSWPGWWASSEHRPA
jgi:hypothetical protein